jgi:hypothetical protein
MQTVTPIEWEVLNATADDFENLEQIYEQVRSVPHGVRLSETADGIRSLVDKGFLSARLENGDPPSVRDDPSYVWKAWFKPTEQGKEILTASKPPEASENSKRKSYFGVFQDRGIHVTREDIDDARREMWGSFDRDDAP